MPLESEFKKKVPHPNIHIYEALLETRAEILCVQVLGVSASFIFQHPAVLESPSFMNRFLNARPDIVLDSDTFVVRETFYKFRFK